MELGPIPAIRRISPVNTPDKGQAFAPVRPTRVGSDDDEGHGESARGMEEDAEDQTDAGSSGDSDASGSVIDLLA